MAGIGFELRRLLKEEGLIQNTKGYAFSTILTVGPMLLSILLVFTMKAIMRYGDAAYAEVELFIVTMTYIFIFSIILTSGISIILTRYLADQLFEKKYENLLDSFYGAVLIVIPIGALIGIVFLMNAEDSFVYKFTAYLLFLQMLLIWIQNIFLSALKDYFRIFRHFAYGLVTALLTGWLLVFSNMFPPLEAVMIGNAVGFSVILFLTMTHFIHFFSRNDEKHYFAFLANGKWYSLLFFSGIFVYAGIYLQNFVYWTREDALVVANVFRLYPYYDVPVFYAYFSVVPTLVLFVITVETSFYEKFRLYYRGVTMGASYKRLHKAKKDMQQSLLSGLSFLAEVQIMFSALAVAIGLFVFPKMGFTMEQLDVYIILVLGFYFFILMFVMLHALMYFDDVKGVFWLSLLYVVTITVFTQMTMLNSLDGLGMFVASFVTLAAVFARVLYVLKNISYYTFSSRSSGERKLHKKKKNPSLKWKAIGAKLSILALVILSGCTPAKQAETFESASPNAAKEDASIVSSSLKEDKRLYERDVDDSVKALYITIWPDEHPDKSSVDWYGLNRLIDRYSTASLSITMAEGEEGGGGPRSGMFGAGDDEPNAKIRLRGNSARGDSQKSYKIKLFDKAGVWNDQRVLNLNKHIGDFSRIRNKLSFDVMEDVDDLTSLRTQFVHLYVNDKTAKTQTETYEDYGLYTHIEQPNKQFLKSHLLDPNGYLYKVTFFEFLQYPDQLKLIDDPTYDEQAFESILEVKGRKDHEKLLKMLEDVNNTHIPIEEVMEKHFDVDNFLTWTAVNILMDNMDTDANNFYLYSPLNSEKWYLLPWDYDGAWELQRREKVIRPYQAGISNYWGSVLHRRYFQTQTHVDQLTAKLEELQQTINSEQITKRVHTYKKKVEPFVMSNPDMQFLPGESKLYSTELKQLASVPENSMKRYFEDLEKPKPFYMDPPVIEKDDISFQWQLSFDLQKDDLFYDVEVAKDPLFTEVIHTEKGLVSNRFEMKRPADGFYYWRVLARDAKGNTQTSFDLYMDEEENFYYGALQLEVN